jgi:type I restriction enzyme S subunit
MRLKLRRGDLLLTEGGDADKLGRGTCWQDELPECIHQNHIFRVRFDLDKFVPEFVSAQMGSLYGKSYFLAHAKQTTGIATINQKVLKAFPLLVPPVTEQAAIIQHLTKRMQSAQRICRLVKDQCAEIRALPALLLQRAFSGEH